RRHERGGSRSRPIANTNQHKEETMFRIACRSIISMAIVGAGLCGSVGIQAAPPAAGLAAKVIALQADVANLTTQVTALQNALTALQGTAGAVQVWQNASFGGPVQRNDATFFT